MQKALQHMNLHLHHVMSDITGVTALRIIYAILAGQRDLEQLVKLRDKRVYKSTPQQMQAVVGDFRVKRLFALSQSLQAARLTYNQPPLSVENFIARFRKDEMPLTAAWLEDAKFLLE